jgi:hypothetical protein
MNIYVQQVQLISLLNKYTKWYLQIISQAKQRAKTKKEAEQITGERIEKHHILPKSFNMGGEKDHNNIAFTTAREHFMCHWLLTKMTEGEFRVKTVRALNIFSISNSKNPRKLTSRQYRTIKMVLERNPGWGHPSPMKGKPSPLKGTTFNEAAKVVHAAGMAKRKGIKQSAETCIKKSLAKKGKVVGPLTEEHKAKISAALAGRSYGPQTDEHREKLSKANIGKKQSQETIAKIVASRTGVKRGPYKKKQVNI